MIVSNSPVLFQYTETCSSRFPMGELRVSLAIIDGIILMTRITPPFFWALNSDKTKSLKSHYSLKCWLDE